MAEPGETEAVRERFAGTAERVAARADAQADELRETLRRFVHLSGEERVLDAGTGAGAVAVALAPLVRAVVGVDPVPELLEQARRRAEGLENVEFLEGDATRLPFEPGSFDLSTCVRVLHHVRRPELVVSELTRVVPPGGRVLVADQLAPGDPLHAIEFDRFERARDPSHTRLLPDNDVRFLLEMNGLVLERSQVRQERRELDPYLDLAGCEGEARERAQALAPGEAHRVELGWYLARRPGGAR